MTARLARPAHAAGLTVSALATVVACAGTVAPRDQWVITVSTDAPVPQLADRLFVQITDDQGNPCDGCTRTFALSADSLPLSFGVEPAAGTQRVWVVLSRAEQAGQNGLPQDPEHFEALGELPAAAGVTEVAIELPTACFGVASDPVGGTTCDPATRALVPDPTLTSGPGLATGTWAPAQAVPCASAAPSGMVCVPGGVFLMGSYGTVDLGGGTASFPEHLVQLSPYFLDVDEVKVGDVRTAIASGKLASSDAPVPNVSDLTQTAGGCTYLGQNDGTNDTLPANCVTLSQASAICTALGKELPTEAQWEFAARNTTTQSTYPWGEDSDVCSEAVIARGYEVAAEAEDDDCETGADGSTLPAGPVAVGTTSSDVTTLGIHDLGGNVAEWLADAFQTYTDTCWSGGAPQITDPSCRKPSSAFPGTQATRGGSWTTQGIYAAAAMRDPRATTPWDPGVGLRCAQKATP